MHFFSIPSCYYFNNNYSKIVINLNSLLMRKISDYFIIIIILIINDFYEALCSTQNKTTFSLIVQNARLFSKIFGKPKMFIFISELSFCLLYPRFHGRFLTAKYTG